MPLPRPRFTVRRMMAAVAVVAVLLGVGFGLKRRYDRFRTLASHYWQRQPLPHEAQREGEFNWCGEMARKYEYAASHPWLPVPPDPPEPR